MNSPGKIHDDQQCAKVEEGMREQTPSIDRLRYWFKNNPNHPPMCLVKAALVDCDTQSTRIRELEAKVEKLEKSVERWRSMSVAMANRLRADNTRLEAEGAAMRRALEFIGCRTEHPDSSNLPGCVVCEAIDQALDSSAGKSILEQIARLERDRDEFHRCLLAREEALKLEGERWVKAMTQRDGARSERTKLTEVVKACEVAIDGRIVWPKLSPECGCVHCEAERRFESALALIHTLQSGEKKEVEK
jgi:outer membrane murein-binding lipoprotein Lpp